jgi:hypothetical protein
MSAILLAGVYCTADDVRKESPVAVFCTISVVRLLINMERMLTLKIKFTSLY